MTCLNRVTLLGRLGQNVELKYTPNKTPVATISLATSETKVDKDGKREQKTEWHRVIVWGKSAENCNRHLSKGGQVYVEGKIQTRNWDDKNGEKRYITEVKAEDVIFLSDKGIPVENNKEQPREQVRGSRQKNSNNHNQGNSSQNRPTNNRTRDMEDHQDWR